MNKCDQFRELIEAYALGALDPEERAALEAHLATGCHDCSRAIEEARWLVCQLAYIAPEATPSDRLKGRLMQTVRAEVQSHAQAKPQALPAKRYVPIWLWVAAAAMLLITLSSTWNMRRLEKETREAERLSYELIDGNQRLEKQLAEAKRESMILMDPKSVKIMMPASDKQGTQLEAKWHPQLGMVVMGDKIPMPAPHHVLQLWLIPKDPKGKPMPSMMTWPDADGKFVLLVSNPPDSMGNVKALAVTVEPEGGSPGPTTTPLWVGGVS
ncbi:MAG TPA: anti-sigma factor [Candidatus Acidoferrum sp.]|nr:anti-sigma factor [Candidatus Acidoferrum sp.]